MDPDLSSISSFRVLSRCSDRLESVPNEEIISWEVISPLTSRLTYFFFWTATSVFGFQRGMARTGAHERDRVVV